MKKRVVIFGGSGFLGSHVVDILTEKDYDVTIFDIKKSPYLKPKQKMIVGDVLDYNSVYKTVKNADYVYHFAALADIEEAALKPVETVKQNILGTTIILDACRQTKIKRFLFASSIYVYSELGSFYKTSKQSCESLIEDYNKAYGLPFTILRYGSLYGPRANESNWIYKILKQAITQNKIVRYGDGEEIREYIHVYDAARCSVEVLDEKFKNQHVIITGQTSIKIKDILTMIKEMMKNKIKIEYKKPIADIHYHVTPYTFSPKLGIKLISNTQIDLGQGILTTLKEIFEKINPDYSKNGIILKESKKI